MSPKWNRLGSIAYTLAIKKLIKEIVCINLMFYVRICDKSSDRPLLRKQFIYATRARAHDSFRQKNDYYNFHLLFVTILELGEVLNKARNNHSVSMTSCDVARRVPNHSESKNDKPIVFRISSYLHWNESSSFFHSLNAFRFGRIDWITC